ncbi:polysaccharide pyruvyl transferase family protein [Pseudarthrobacter sp. NamE2]|uniref:polysaccharide pyruvyl transferase family protein n=1 Tax=Pseudarthrobacter sp. NamE2 TaxID=2576838 RepID=UPI0010FDCEF4|nr:polysaccharide pyruvyl transferase family protein [Pseudarthrobacter sp. NamE2]TLM85644.1 polysaccharide pyruvyl transferase family protein [Pseudarthrobacter sp. NamE2]
MSFYLISPAGNPNYGDELIAAGWLRYLAETRPETDVWLDCPNPGLATELFHGMHPRLHTTNTLWRACWEAASTGPGFVMDRVVHLVRNYGSPAYDLGIDRLRSMESIHVLGGGYLNSLWPANAGVIAGAAAVRSLTGAKLYATGLSVVPLLTGTYSAEGRDLIGLLRSFDHVTVRDEESASVLGLPLGLDDAFLAAEHELRKGLARGGADLVVCLQNDLQTKGQSEETLERARGVVEAAVAEGKTV